MSTITTDDVRHLAQLSNLQLTDDEVENLRDDLENILGYIEQLGEIDTTGVEPTYQVTGLENVWRDDEVRAPGLRDRRTSDGADAGQRQGAIHRAVRPEPHV